MFRIPGVPGKDLCDKNLGCWRRDVRRVGGGSRMGLTLNNVLRCEAMAANSPNAGLAGWGKAKHVLMIDRQDRSLRHS